MSGLSRRSVSRILVRLASGSVGHTAASIGLVGDDLDLEALGLLVGADRHDRHVERAGPDILDEVVGTVCAEGDFDVRMVCVKVGQQSRDVDAV